MYTYEQYCESAEYLKKEIGDFVPEIALILGSGLGDFGDRVTDCRTVSYADVPHMKTSTSPEHKGRFIFGKIEGRNVAVMQGRLHPYEGYTFADTAYPVRVMKLLGAKALFVTNSAGAVNENYSVGDIMIIKDHLKFGADSPLTGINIEEFGPRFSDMSNIYTPRLRNIAKKCAENAGISLQEGVYMYFLGPQYETPAEIRAAGILGADVIGMSTVAETIIAAHCGMDVLGFSLCTNMAAGVTSEPLSNDEVLYVGQLSAKSFGTLISECIKNYK